LTQEADEINPSTFRSQRRNKVLQLLTALISLWAEWNYTKYL